MVLFSITNEKFRFNLIAFFKKMAYILLLKFSLEGLSSQQYVNPLNLKNNI